MKRSEPLQLNLREILRARLDAKKRRWVPGWLVGMLERVIHQEELNGILRHAFPEEGSAFARAALDDLQIQVDVEGMENIPSEGRFVFASNHPLGGLDGIALIAVLGERYGDGGIKFLVNDMLMNVEPLQPVFLPINKYGSQGREAVQVITAAYEGDGQLLVFPAGLVSRLHPGGEISDLEWQKAFVIKAMQSGRDIIPVKFEGLNSRRFYRVARWRKKLGLKVNIEQALLPGELCKARGSRFTIKFGAPIPHARLSALGASPKAKARAIREIVYRL